MWLVNISRVNSAMDLASSRSVKSPDLASASPTWTHASAAPERVVRACELLLAPVRVESSLAR